MKHKEITDIILKSFYEVYNELGEGFLESVYESALSMVLTGYGLLLNFGKNRKSAANNHNKESLTPLFLKSWPCP
ncbi:GxxExxY protein [Desulfobacula sp.]|uniref:GxxExxY protein n=1 Tax=Desulfobacula sp. TaxID=2593537 RepID=UPI0025C0BE2F|nr:GxxExxY protein [Desulfobacula sp.]MBC2704268.1 hypothetical protein [Desulfobacula sp.]